MEDAYRTALACLPDMSAINLPRLIGLAGGAQKLWYILVTGGRRAEALVGGIKAGIWREECRRRDPARLLGELQRQGIRVMSPGGPGFPPLLEEIYDPPALLFSRGGVIGERSACVAVVGARKASNYGRWVAEHIGEELARRGIVVVSGAAYGVDGHAHLGCLKAGGFTVAVLGCGVDRVYPPGHARLLANIAAEGCVISEYPPGSEPLPWRFPHRNRIIAGMSHAVVVVEASEKSGALITADLALEEGREVLAVPGPINSALSQGTNALIQKGAKLVRGVDDICEELSLPEGACREEAGEVFADLFSGGEEGLKKVESGIIEALNGGPVSLDALALELSFPPGELLARLTEMALKGWVAADAEGRYRLMRNPSLG